MTLAKFLDGEEKCPHTNTVPFVYYTEMITKVQI